MKFYIFRTSDPDGTHKTCHGAEAKYHSEYSNKTWWSIEISTLEELIKISELEPDGILIKEFENVDYGGIMRGIEIVDGYLG